MSCCIVLLTFLCHMPFHYGSDYYDVGFVHILLGMAWMENLASSFCSLVAYSQSQLSINELFPFSVMRIPVISKIINIMIMSKQYLFRIYKITLFSMIEYDIICHPLPCLLPNIFWSVHGVHK